MNALEQLKPSFRKTFFFIVDYMKMHGYGPTTQDISDGVPLSSKSVAMYHRDKLVDKGFLTFDPDRARSISIVGSLTLIFYGSDAAFIRETFGEHSELAVIDQLRQEVGVMEYGT